jgi:integrase
VPKNDSSFRKISIPASILPILEEHRKNELIKKEHLKARWFYGNDNPHEEDFVFTQRNGKMIYVRSLSQWFLKFRRKHGLKNVTFHGLRHTSTVAMIANGINITNISSKLGHAKTSTTQDIYSHALLDVEKESANVFENIIEKAQNETNGTQSGTKKDEL